ncbi:tumor necrosis factor receptor superfamily member 27 [Erpetoichthys calabaricus]|uniref:tumor necrosis factor receptor superfamily member 27 n=1 Tax=Erpetoichthys calabaricus TaxID=27687 RepID=UPI00223423BD|nr:tumor necrosis factor receptor superfamily member 27 [Erpetoichthys calabaricus]
MDCLENEYMDNNGQCHPCRTCEPGLEPSKECGYGMGGDATCVSCQPRRYKEGSGYHGCKPCLSCVLINRVQRSNCSATSNALCGDCLPGFYTKTRIGGLQDLECIPCTAMTLSSSTPQCGGGAHKVTSGQTASPQLDMAVAAVVFSALISAVVALMVMLFLYCKCSCFRKCDKEFQVSFKRNTEESGSKSGRNVPEESLSHSGTLGPESDADPSADLHHSFTSCIQSLVPSVKESSSSEPRSSHMLRLSETQPLMRDSVGSNGSSPTELIYAHPAVTSREIFCATLWDKWDKHMPVECTELDFHYLTPGEKTLPTNPAEGSNAGTSSYSSTLAEYMQDLVSRCCEATQGLHLGCLPLELVTSASLRLDAFVPGMRNYRHLGEEMGIPTSVLSHLDGFQQVFAYLSSCTLTTVPDFLEACCRIQRFDILFLLCDTLSLRQQVNSENI